MASTLSVPVAVQEHRPQALLLSFLGSLMLDEPDAAVPSSVFLRVLADLGVAGPAARTTLNRMTDRGLLQRHRSGRTVAFSVTDFGRQLLGRNRERVESDDPLTHPDCEWTLLSYSMPESRRDLRHQIRATLTWAGFGGLRDGLWIAPGTVDVRRIFDDAGLENAAGLADWFAARPLPGTDIGAMVRRAWDIDEVAAAHQAFLARWNDPPVDLDVLAGFTLLGADWLHVLRVDPGLPAEHLPAGWPGTRTPPLRAELFHRWRPEAIDLLRRRLHPG